MTLIPRDPGFWGIENCDPDGRDYRRAPAYRDMKERLTDVMLDRVERAFPGARAQVQWSEAATPATQTRYARTTGGAPFGLAVNPRSTDPPGPAPTPPSSGCSSRVPARAGVRFARGRFRSRGMPPDSVSRRHGSAWPLYGEGVDPPLKALHLARHNVGIA
jgi:hypothetical protein